MREGKKKKNKDGKHKLCTPKAGERTERVQCQVCRNRHEARDKRGKDGGGGKEGGGEGRGRGVSPYRPEHAAVASGPRRSNRWRASSQGKRQYKPLQKLKACNGAGHRAPNSQRLLILIEGERGRLFPVILLQQSS